MTKQEIQARIEELEEDQQSNKNELRKLKAALTRLNEEDSGQQTLLLG